MSAGAYSNEVSFSAPGGEKTCVELPMPMRGVLDRFIIKQAGGVAVAFDITIYDRKGACENESDLHTQNGAIVDITDNGSGFARVQSTGHNLKPGDVIEVKGSDEAAYNVPHHVVAIVDADNFDTGVAYTADGTGGRWQTEPLFPTVDPEMHEVYAPAQITSGTTHKGTDLDIAYENRDNQSVTARRRKSALYLEIEPAGAGAKQWVCSYTAEADAVI